MIEFLKCFVEITLFLIFHIISLICTICISILTTIFNLIAWPFAAIKSLAKKAIDAIDNWRDAWGTSIK